MDSGLRSLLFFLFLFFNAQINASLEDYYPYQVGPTSSNYGYTGLLEMPSARFMGEGGLKFGISASYPNEYTFIVASPFQWLEAGYRYTVKMGVTVTHRLTTLLGCRVKRNRLISHICCLVG